MMKNDNNNNSYPKIMFKKFSLNINLLQKIFLVGSLSATVAFAAIQFLKKDPTTRQMNLFTSRQQLLKNPNIKMLYSAMSFFYLYGFKQNEPQSFLTVAKLMDMETPHIIAVPLSSQDYEAKFNKALNHPKYKKAMQKFMDDVKNQNLQAISSNQDFNLKNLQMLMLIDYCNKNKMCRIVYARKQNSYYQKLAQSANNNPDGLSVNKAKVEDYTDAIIEVMRPQFKFSLSPRTPFKYIIGLIEPQNIQGVSERWKEKFKIGYGHIVYEDDEVLAKEVMEKEEQEKNSNKKK